VIHEQPLDSPFYLRRYDVGELLTNNYTTERALDPHWGVSQPRSVSKGLVGA